MSNEQDFNAYLVFASKAGADNNPAWYFNLRANPRVRVEVGDEVFDAEATELTGAGRDAKYAEQGRRYPGFLDYELKTTRIIPVVALSRVG